MEREYINRNSETLVREKGIKKIFDVEITLWDGSGIHSPEVTQYVKRAIKSEETPTSILWRLPYMKGMTHEVNFRQWFAEHNINNIKDIFGIEHNIQDVDMIVTNSFYKGYGYFKQYDAMAGIGDYTGISLGNITIAWEWLLGIIRLIMNHG